MSATERSQPRRRGLTTVLLAAGCLVVGLAATRATVRHLYAQRELAGLEEEIAQTHHGNERLERSLERMKQPAWLALLARDRLNYKRPDETVVFVYKSQKQGTIAPPSGAPMQGLGERSNGRLWWEWLLGK